MQNLGSSLAGIVEPRQSLFEVQLHIVIRLCTERDLPKLEWYGLYTEHREIIRQAFEDQQRGFNAMLVAAVNNAIGGQIWVDLKKRAENNSGLIWAFRVCPWLQGLGIGTRLLDVAEAFLTEAGFEFAELGVEKWNEPAKRFYERRGYQCTGHFSETVEYVAPGGAQSRMLLDEWAMRKRLLE